METNDIVVICSYCDKVLMPEEAEIKFENAYFCNKNCENAFTEGMIDAHL